MISYKIIYLLLGIFTTTHLCAALPPLYETLKEYKALLDSPQLTENLVSADAIENIQRDNYGFLIKTNKHTMKVDVVYDPQTHPGPSKFHFVFHKAESLDEKS